ATVADPAVIATGGFSFSAVEGALSASQTVATFTDPGGPEGLAHYAATIDWGDGSSSAGTIAGNKGGFTRKGGHNYAEEGTKAITTTVSHDAAPDATATSTATIDDPAVVATGGFAFSAVEGSLSAAQTVATFTDPGGAEALADYAATIDWGDNS